MLRPSGSELRSKDWRSPDKQSEGTRIRALSPLNRIQRSSTNFAFLPYTRRLVRGQREHSEPRTFLRMAFLTTNCEHIAKLEHLFRPKVEWGHKPTYAYPYHFWKWGRGYVPPPNFSLFLRPWRLVRLTIWRWVSPSVCLLVRLMLEHSDVAYSLWRSLQRYYFWPLELRPSSHSKVYLERRGAQFSFFVAVGTRVSEKHDWCSYWNEDTLQHSQWFGI